MKWYRRAWLFLSTAPVWVPALLVAVVLWGLGWLNVTRIYERTGGEWRAVGLSLNLGFPIQRLPLVSYTVQLNLGFIWWPPSWAIVQHDTMHDSGVSFSGRFGPLDLAFYFVEPVNFSPA